MLYNYLLFSTILLLLDMIYLHIFSKQLINQIIDIPKLKNELLVLQVRHILLSEHTPKQVENPCLLID